MHRIAALKKLIDDHEEEINNLSGSHVRLQYFFEKFIDEMPLPAWIKAASEDGRFHILTVNKKYTEEYGITREEYQVREDIDLWDEHTSKSFYTADEKVRSENRNYFSIEAFNLNGRNFNVLVWKWPIHLDGKVVAVCGMVMPFDSRLDPLVLNKPRG